MATITATLAPARGNEARGRQPYYVQQIIDLTANSINPDIDGAADGAYAPSVTVSADLVITSADTLDLTLAGGGASFTAGEIRVFACLLDVSDNGIATADEVDRDTLA